jgi:hypothetical protein
MKKNGLPKGLILTGSLRRSGVTIYERNGQLVTRTATSDEKRSNTRPQFIQRQKMRHTMALWKMLKYGCKKIMFTEHKTAYLNFSSLANRLPAVYVERIRMDQASFLMPGIPMSDGTLPTIQLQLGEVNGTPALLTDLANDDWTYRTKFRLYTAVQTLENDFLPRVRFSTREVTWRDITLVDGRMTLVSEEFADEMKGWALVRVIDGRCSPQGIVTRCTLYQKYTTEEALETAAKSYGGLTNQGFLSPW